LDCPNNEQLWKLLRQQYAPNSDHSQLKQQSSALQIKQNLSRQSTNELPQYQLALRNIHTNTITRALVSFIKDALGRNTLQSIYFQQSSIYPTLVDIDYIFKNVVKRHRASLRKVLIDWSEKRLDGRLVGSRWRRWSADKDMISFITSGKMPALRELGLCVNGGDWHHFLRRLPGIPHLRSLYIPQLATVSESAHTVPGHGGNVAATHLFQTQMGTMLDPRERALQVLDIVTLRPEIEICYVGIGDKCFEIQEGDPDREIVGLVRDQNALADEEADTDSNVDEEDEDEDADEDVLEDDEDQAAMAGGAADDEDHDSNDDSNTDEEASDDEGGIHANKGSRLRLREILFYDDKVSIFRARHGRL